MTSRDFCYWLQGCLEIAGPNHLDAHQIALIQKHLSLVFKHEIDPSFGDQKKQNALNEIHGPGGPLIRC